MRPSLTIVAALAAATTIAVAAAAQHEGHDTGAMKMPGAMDEAPVKSVTGEVIDITCYLRMAAKGPDHTKCAVYCAGLGMPIGILEDGTDAIYLVLPQGHAAPKDAVEGHIGQRVSAKLKVFESGGMNAAEVLEIAAAEG